MADRESDTVRTSIVRQAGQFFVQMVHQHIFPLPYDRVHYDNGRRFRVRVEEHKTEQDTKPLSLEDMKPDVSIDS